MNSKRYTAEQKLKIVKEAEQAGINKTKLANCWNISRPTLDKWIEQYKKNGVEGLVNSKPGSKPLEEQGSEKDRKIRSLERKLRKQEEEIEILKKWNAAIEEWQKKQK